MKVAKRRIVVLDRHFYWFEHHTHQPGVCAERFVAYPQQGKGRLELVFREQPGVVTTVGTGWGGYQGNLVVDGASYNLNRPRLAASLIRAALREGWQPDEQVFAPPDAIAFFRKHVARSASPFSG